MQVNSHLHKYRHLHIFCAVLPFYSLFVQFIQLMYDGCKSKCQMLFIKHFVFVAETKIESDINKNNTIT